MPRACDPSLSALTYGDYFILLIDEPKVDNFIEYIPRTLET